MELPADPVRLGLPASAERRAGSRSSAAAGRAQGRPVARGQCGQSRTRYIQSRYQDQVEIVNDQMNNCNSKEPGGQ